MTRRIGLGSIAVVVAVAGVLAGASSASAIKLVLKAPATIVAPEPITAVSTNVEAGEVKCALVELSGVLLTNSKHTDKAEFFTGTASGCSGTYVGNETTTLEGFPWKVKLTAGTPTGPFLFHGTPRLMFTDTLSVAPFTCKYKSAAASDSGTYASTLFPLSGPLVLETPLAGWAMVPYSSAAACGPGVLTDSFQFHLGPASGPLIEDQV